MPLHSNTASQGWIYCQESAVFIASYPEEPGYEATVFTDEEWERRLVVGASLNPAMHGDVLVKLVKEFLEKEEFEELPDVDDGMEDVSEHSELASNH